MCSIYILSYLFINQLQLLIVMNIINTILLGIVQGATEFLPVSSSGHLVIASKLLGTPSTFEFDVLVNFGTLLAVIIYYRTRIWQIITDIFERRDISMALKIILATIPAAIFGFVFQGLIEKHLHSTWVVVIMLMSVGIIMVLSKSWPTNKRLPVNKDLHGVSYRQSVAVGFAQCLALISGTSRSGVTMLAALKLGFTKEKAAEWSFLIGIPIILGASLKVLVSDAGMNYVQQQTGTFLLANAVSFISGFAAIHILIKILKKNGLYWFGWYRIALATVLIVLLSAKLI